MIRTLVKQRRATLPIGVDFGHESVRVAEVVRAQDRWIVTKLARSERPHAGGEDPSDSPTDTTHLQRCLRQVSFRRREATVVLSPPDVEFHSIELPPTVLGEDPARAAQIVRWEVERLVTLSDAAVETRYWSLPPPHGPGPNAIGVAAALDTVTRATRACSDAGLACSRVDTSATAHANLGVALKTRGRNDVWGVLDLGERQARMVVCLGETPVLVRVVGSGQQEWTDRIATSLNISPKAAGLQKRHYGITPDVRGVRAGDGGQDRQGALPSEALGAITFGALRSELHALAAEVKRSFDYVLGCYTGRTASDLMLVGGGAVMRNVAKVLGDASGITVRPASDYLSGEGCRIEFSQTKTARLEDYAVAVGTTLEL